jgi:hypothetical protein
MYKILEKSFDTEKDYLDFIVENEKLVIDTKKSIIKEADGFGGMPTIQKDINATKNSDANATEILVKVVINSCNILDSHKDVHVEGIWNKSLKENGKSILHLQEHGRKFRDVISRGNDLKAYVENVTWKSLGFDMEGSTQILGFDSLVKQSRNAEMFKEYSEGNVTEHSVGMQYIKMVTCINNEDYPVQKENWDKYAPVVANKKALEQTKVFWAVLEAKAIEGSSVLFGSNSFTPTRKFEEPTPVETKDTAILKWLKN